MRKNWLDLKYRDFMKARQKANAERSYLKKVHGITPEEYMERAKRQGGKCAICGKEGNKGRKFIIKTGGLICSSCGLGLTSFRNDSKILRNAIAFLETGLYVS